ncbi:MAG: long-chain fatty acid--CoA ligase [Gemmatimonadetes bacterium]|jgi:long-chain acyl-CoA synthetase|nr:long-chain fatty acid--CoA ligase [Gemmatimonadota bacterium]
MTTSLSYAANESPVPEGTLIELFLEAVDNNGERRALEFLPSEGQLDGITYDQVFARTKHIAAALEQFGVKRGDRAAILSENRPEWALCDYACLCSGVIDVPIYPTLAASQIAYVLKDSGAKLVFASSAEQVQKAVEAVAECPHPIQIVAIDATADLPTGVISWADFLTAGETFNASWTDGDFRAQALQADPADIATVLYTSGTTGDPKGVMLTHNNVSSNVRATCMVLAIGQADNTISFLPLSHILQRMVDYLCFWTGCRLAYARSMPTLIEDMQVIKPTLVVSVPRIYEKVYNGVMECSGVKKIIVTWAVAVADRVADVRLAGQQPAGLLAVKYAIADKLVFAKVKAAVGGRLRFFVSGGGPLSPVLNRFFYSIGLTILEGYGLTETSPVTNVSTLEHFRIGTVGPPVPGTEVRIAEDGEILIRGPQVMKGYYDKPDATAEAISAEGWFSTGDIGEIDEDGYLKITDRKKDIIVTAGGKNIAPQPIENLVKTNRLVEQVVMIGDRRRYCVLLIVPAFDPLERWASENSVSWSSRTVLIADPRVKKHVEHEVLGMLTDLASFETPKKIALLSEELTVENGFLTPTLKVKRRVVQERLGAVIDGLYEEEAADDATG